MLDYKSLLKMSAANTYFQELFLYQDKHLLKLALLAFEDTHQAWRTNVTGEVVYAPCYGCLKTLSTCHFRSIELYTSTTASGERAFKRRCETCSSEIPLTGLSRVIGGWLYCAGCKTMTHLVGREWCGVWDHTRGGRITCSRKKPLTEKHSLCRDCKPEGRNDAKGMGLPLSRHC